MSAEREKPRTPDTTRKQLKRIPWRRRITISFRARRAADAKSFYVLTSELRGTPREGCSLNMRGTVSRDIEAGHTVTEALWVHHRCRGTLTVRVGYEQQSGPTMMPFHADGPPNAKVGTAAVRLR